MSTTNQEYTPTFGEELVGYKFNPSGDDKVAKAKRLFADAADLMNDHYLTQYENHLGQLLFSHTVGEILNAQMNVVKILTLKY